ncbi:MAG: cupredoxin domain-containing protein [Dehalococcoidia bacterium]
MFKFILVVFALAAIPFCLACGDDDDDSSSGTTVDASLKDFQMTLDKTSVSSGDVTFKIKNNGPSQHEFVVDRTDLQADNLPYDETDAKVVEDSPQLTNIDEKEAIDAGDSETLTVNLPPGHYVLFCNIPAHYQQGMRIDFTVK